MVTLMTLWGSIDTVLCVYNTSFFLDLSFFFHYIAALKLTFQYLDIHYWLLKISESGCWTYQGEESFVINMLLLIFFLELSKKWYSIYHRFPKDKRNSCSSPETTIRRLRHLWMNSCNVWLCLHSIRFCHLLVLLQWYSR